MDLSLQLYGPGQVVNQQLAVAGQVVKLAVTSQVANLGVVFMQVT